MPVIYLYIHKIMCISYVNNIIYIYYSIYIVYIYIYIHYIPIVTMLSQSSSACTMLSMSYIAHCLMVALSPIQPSWFFPWQFFPSITRPGKRLHNELERSTMFHGKIHYFDWVIFNSYFDKLPEGIP